MANELGTEHHKVFPATKNGETLIVVPRGDATGFLDIDVNNEMNTLLSLLGTGGLDNVVVDLNASSYFGSVVIGVINSLALKACENGGRAAICNASEDMLGVLKVMKLDVILPHYPSLRKALKAVRL